MIRIGHVGLGYWGPNVLRAFSEVSDCCVKRICDASSQNLKKVLMQFPQVQASTDFRDILKDPEIDAVVIAVPGKDHFAFARDSLNAGKHVFVEKPLALHTHQCTELIDIAAAKKRVLMVGHLLRYHPAVNRVKEYLRKGEIGNIRYLYSTRVNLGKIRDVENVMWSLAPHDISVILSFLDTMSPIGVTAVGESYIHKNICDVAFITLFFPDDVMAAIHVSWLDPHKIRKITVVGDKKMIVFDDMQSSEKIRLYDSGVDVNYKDFSEYVSLRAGDVLMPKVDMKEPLVIESQHFCDCITQNKKPLSDGIDGLNVVKILEAADISLQKKGAYIPLNT